VVDLYDERFARLRFLNFEFENFRVWDSGVSGVEFRVWDLVYMATSFG